MNALRITALSFTLALFGCSGGEESTPNTGSGPAASAAPAGAPPTAAMAAGDALQGIVLRVAPGGRPDAFCIPEWSIANQTSVDIPGLLIQIGWHGKDGAVLQAAGEFGTLQEGLSPGRRVDKTLDGHASACGDLKVVLGTYACRDENAVRMPCPGPVHLLTEGGIQGDTSALQEGRMRGAVEG
ncbi:MAG: hypothetical protein MEQ07_10935 [Aquimonas sp.]|nr:hypothetical protein [Aquimonas sp.]